MVVEGKEFVARPIVTNSGATYVAVVGFPRPADEFSPPPGPQRPLRDLGIAIMISGIVCFWLARDLSASIVRLRNAAQELSREIWLRARKKTMSIIAATKSHNSCKSSTRWRNKLNR